MNPLILFINALVSALAAFGGGFLSHYSSDQRERLARQAAFRREQLKELYGPVLARISLMYQRWQVVKNLYQHKERIIKQYGLKGEDHLKTIGIAQDYHEEVLRIDKGELEEILKTVANNFYLAEPSTRKQFVGFCLYVERLRAVKYPDRPLDHTGNIDSGVDTSLASFFDDVEARYDSIAAQLRTANYSEIYEPTKAIAAAPVLPELPAPKKS